MKILLLGEYSNLHWTLAQGLRLLGHQVTVASDGDGFKNYNRDIDFALKSNSILDKIACLFSILKNKNKLKGYDIVQLINPCFTRIHFINIHLYRFLKKHNSKLFLGAFGDDYFYTKACLDKDTFRFSEFFVNGKQNNLKANTDLVNAWVGTSRGRANIEIADSCDGIIACLYEYYKSYETHYSNKLHFVPLPINTLEIPYKEQSIPNKVTFFIGINKERSEVKGTDMLYNALVAIHEKYPTETEVIRVESLPYTEYIEALQQANVVLDQIYSYSPAMSGLLSLASGKLVVSGAEPEMYALLNENENQPILNIRPSTKNIYNKLESIILHKEDIPNLSKNGRLFIEQHHDYIQVAKQYIKVWNS